MDFVNILSEKEGNMAVITINRPNKLNALNRETITELHRAFDELDKDKEVQVIIVTGSGPKAFVAGADISEFADFSIKEGSILAARGQELLFDFVEQLTTPVIAAINGFALGGGLELAMACHFRVASDNARMGLPEVTLGLIPGYGGTQRLPQLVGKGRALEMIMTGEMIGVEKAHLYGLVNHIVAQEELLSYCKQIGEKIAKNSPKAIATAINAVNAGFSRSGYRSEIEGFGASFGTADFKEGTSAFLEKRKPNFKGE
ncbi:enoyl-CoA hydratase/isomerase family protein [Robertkochia sediminum]|uniref:enoyl-CoA hydratase/isomerase family protein n=1 Tax=Robertkochia sediminum TaxID=2785326 RepID=UPI0019313796|nr:enoyl-CoA hydratase-related protein [Robertkochia sediminum]MBL7471849.1 enoyl-CoA hydratase/isomerase family protein [Robertkochia sediminum]